MIGRRDISSWLEGPGGAGGPDGATGFPGERLGRPAEGAGSIGRFGRRLVGLVVDWLLALVIANGLLRSSGLGSFAPLLVFSIEHLLLVGTVGATIGHRLVGLRVERLDGGLPGPALGLVRSLVLSAGVPALLWDKDQRGLHDRLAGTVVVRT